MEFAGKIQIPVLGSSDLRPSNPISRLSPVLATTTRVARNVSFDWLYTETAGASRAMDAAICCRRSELTRRLVLHPINQDKEHDNRENTRDDPDHCYGIHSLSFLEIRNAAGLLRQQLYDISE